MLSTPPVRRHIGPDGWECGCSWDGGRTAITQAKPGATDMPERVPRAWKSKREATEKQARGTDVGAGGRGGMVPGGSPIVVRSDGLIWTAPQRRPEGWRREVRQLHGSRFPQPANRAVPPSRPPPSSTPPTLPRRFPALEPPLPPLPLPIPLPSPLVLLPPSPAIPTACLSLCCTDTGS